MISYVFCLVGQATHKVLLSIGLGSVGVGSLKWEEELGSQKKLLSYCSISENRKTGNKIKVETGDTV